MSGMQKQSVFSAYQCISLMFCSEMDELLTDISPELVDEFSSDFFANRGRKVLHDSRRWRVLDTWIGDPPQYYRQAVIVNRCSCYCCRPSDAWLACSMACTRIMVSYGLLSSLHVFGVWGAVYCL